ncbi:hypothetical protein ACFVR1_06880 [Psychrobacillus sp. NPDC058041]|uniref:hypothetical protein n=1 Tax=Psychrobacillus sp. NPDC058041 TaxID=3346310 RepID=UPI0036DE020A
MKKKAIKIAASTAVAASAFVAAAPAHQADAATNVNQLVTDAQNAGTVLKWAISVEGTADFVTRPYNQYNAAKKAVAAVEAAAKGLSTSEKLSVDAKLVDAKLQVKRAEAYIDAITSSEKIKDLTSKLNAAIASGDIEKVEPAYHTASAEYRKQAKLLDRVYGQSTRDEIRNAVKPAIEKAVASVKNEVTVNMLVKAADADAKAGKIVEANAKLAEAQAILDANKLQWQAALQKSVTDALAAVPPLPGNITVETAAFHGEAGQTYAVVATVKTTSGALYTGPVKVSFTDAAKESKGEYSFVSANGKPVTGDKAEFEVVNGQMVLTVTSTAKVTDGSKAIAGGKVKIQTYPNGYDKAAVDSTTTGTLNFYDKVTGSDDFSTSNEVKYVDAANNYFVTTDLKKYVLSAAGNVYQDTNNSILTLDAFKAKLAKGDLVTGTYNSTGGSSVKILVHKVAAAEFALDQENADDTDFYRVEGTSVKLSGTGEAGKLVAIYKGTDNVAPYTQVQVGSNGLWSTTVSVTAETVFTARHVTAVNEAPKSYDAIKDEDGLETLTVVPGKFTAKYPAVKVDAGESLTGGPALVFTADLAADKGNVEIAKNASITLVDGSLLSATYTNGVGGTTFTATATGFDINFGTPSKLSVVGKNLTGSLSVTEVTGVTNAYGFKLNFSKATGL